MTKNLFLTPDYNTFAGDTPPFFREYPLSIAGPPTLDRQLLADIVARLRNQSILIVYNNDVIAQETLAVQIIRRFFQIERLSCRYWTDEEIPPSLNDRFGTESNTEGVDTIYWVLNTFPTVINRIDLQQLQRRLRERNQYLLLVTRSSRANWQPLTDSRYWYPLPENCYDRAYLEDELRRRLRSLNGSPLELQRALASYRFSNTYLIKYLVDSLGTLPKIELFFAALASRYRGSPATIQGVQSTLDEVRRLDVDQVIDVLFQNLPNTEAQLLACGFCFFGGVHESHFLKSLEQFLQEPWQYRFNASFVLDYLQLNSLTTLVDLAHGKVHQRHPQQLPALFSAAWPELQRHMHKTLAVCCRLIIDSANPRPPRLTNREEEQPLRMTIARAMGMMAVRSPQELQEVLLKLASHDNWGVQLAAARILSTWYADDEGRADCLELLRQWLSQRWPQESTIKVEKHVERRSTKRGPSGREDRQRVTSKDFLQLVKKEKVKTQNVDLTMARLLNDVLQRTPVLFDDELLRLGYGLIRNACHDTLAYLLEVVFPKLPARSTDTLLEMWRRNPLIDSVVALELDAEKRAFAKALRSLIMLSLGLLRYSLTQESLLQRNLQDKTSERLLAELRTAAQKRYKAVLDELHTTHLVGLSTFLFDQDVVNASELLLLLSKVVAPHTTVLDALLRESQTKGRHLNLLAAWKIHYQKEQTKSLEYQKGDKYDIHFWTVVLPSVAAVYEKFDTFPDFEWWLETWLSSNGSHYRWRIVEVLVAVHRQQAKAQGSEGKEAADSRTQLSTIRTALEAMILPWLADRKQSAYVHQVVFLFYAERIERTIAKAALKQTTPFGLGLTPLLLIPFHAGYRRAFFHIRPLANNLADADSESWRTIMYHWTTISWELRYLALSLWVARQDWRLRRGLINFRNGLLRFLWHLILLPWRIITLPYYTIRSLWDFVFVQSQLAAKD